MYPIREILDNAIYRDGQPLITEIPGDTLCRDDMSYIATSIVIEIAEKIKPANLEPLHYIPEHNTLVN
jgi:hypothetical protein